MNSSDEIANEIARLMRDPDALRHERQRMPSFARRGHYDSNQPRVPAGQSGGGQWADTGRSAGDGGHQPTDLCWRRRKSNRYSHQPK
jgi:hypothetical protein